MEETSLQGSKAGEDNKTHVFFSQHLGGARDLILGRDDQGNHRSSITTSLGETLDELLDLFIAASSVTRLSCHNPEQGGTHLPDLNVLLRVVLGVLGRHDGGDDDSSDGGGGRGW